MYVSKTTLLAVEKEGGRRMVALSSRGIFHDAFCHRWHLSLKEE